MFDIGFWELVVIAVVALLVIGPERLPGVARKAGYWLGRGRRFISEVKADIDREMAADELRRVLKEQADTSGIHEILEETKKAVEESGSNLEETRRQVEQSAAELEQRAQQDYLVKARPERQPGSERGSATVDPTSSTDSRDTDER